MVVRHPVGVEERPVLHGHLGAAHDDAPVRLVVQVLDQAGEVVDALAADAGDVRVDRPRAGAQDQVPGPEPLALDLDGVLVDDRGGRVDDVLHVQLFLGLPVHDGVRVGTARLEQVDDLQDAGLLLVERREPQLALHVPGQVELAGAFGEQVMRDAGLVRAGAAQEGPGVDGELAAAAGPEEGRAEPAAGAAADEDGVVLAAVLIRPGHVPQALGVVAGVGDDVVDQQGPLAHGQRGAVRAAVTGGQFAERVDPGPERGEVIRRVAYVDHAVQVRPAAGGPGRSPRDEEPRGHRPSRSSAPADQGSALVVAAPAGCPRPGWRAAG